jgi:hypothetical protein
MLFSINIPQRFLAPVLARLLGFLEGEKMNKGYVLPPLVKDGNPLSAYGLNQLIGSINEVRSEYFDYNIMKQRTLMVNSFGAWESSYILVHAFKTLYIQVQVEGLNDMGDLKIYAKKTGKNQTSYLIHTAPVTTSPQVLTIQLNMDTNQNGFNVSYGEIYMISFRNTYEDSGGVVCLYMYEFDSAITPVAPTIPTITSSTVIDENYLNNIISSVRSIPSRPKVNVPFNGVGSPGDYNASGYMRWLGRHRCKYIFYGCWLIDGEVEIQFKVNNQVIDTVNSGSGSVQFYNRSYNFQTNPAGITVPAIGADYDFSAEFDYVDEGHPAAAAFVTYAYESDW